MAVSLANSPILPSTLSSWLHTICFVRALLRESTRVACLNVSVLLSMFYLLTILSASILFSFYHFFHALYILLLQFWRASSLKPKSFTCPFQKHVKFSKCAQKASIAVNVAIVAAPASREAAWPSPSSPSPPSPPSPEPSGD